MVQKVLVSLQEVIFQFFFVLHYFYFTSLTLKLGDPEDRTLRKVETEVLIPKIMRERCKTEKCVEFKNGFFWIFFNLEI